MVRKAAQITDARLISPNDVLVPDRTMEPWNSTPAQRSAARLLAIGYTQVGAARALGIGERTVRDWMQIEDFNALIDAYHAAAWSRIEPGVMANVDFAIQLQRQVFAGELKASDPRYIESTKLLDRILDRLLHIESAKAGDETTRGQVNVTLNAGGGR